MNTAVIALQLMAAQGLLGAFDTLYHHELTKSFARRITSSLQLTIHAARALLYSVLFIGLSAWEWHGLWVFLLLAVFGAEVVLTLWEFVVRDQTRLLPASERITPTILAINAGTFVALLALNTLAWMSEPTALEWKPHGPLSVFLGLCGIGVGLTGLRDALAVVNLGEVDKRERYLSPVHFSDAAEHVLVTGATGPATNDKGCQDRRHPWQASLWRVAIKIGVEHAVILKSRDRKIRVGAANTLLNGLQGAAG